MQRRAPRRPINGHAVPHSPSANHSLALVRVDGADIRKKIRKAYEKALRDLENSRRLLDRFHQTDQPQFTRWLNSNFGALLTELRELNQKLAADDAIVILVQNEVLFGGSSYARAYQRVMELKENPEPPPPRPGGGPERDVFEAGNEWGSPGDEEELAEEFMNELFGTSRPGAGSGEAHDSRMGPSARPAAPVLAGKRLKELYRAVVRRLHPDSQREMTAQKTEWWHQAQAAYEAGGMRPTGSSNGPSNGGWPGKPRR
jgi:hypothetical protein